MHLYSSFHYDRVCHLIAVNRNDTVFGSQLAGLMYLLPCSEQHVQADKSKDNSCRQRTENTGSPDFYTERINYRYYYQRCTDKDFSQIILDGRFGRIIECRGVL